MILIERLPAMKKHGGDMVSRALSWMVYNYKEVQFSRPAGKTRGRQGPSSELSAALIQGNKPQTTCIPAKYSTTELYH